MQLLPKLSEYLANEITHEILRIPEPYHTRLIALLKLLSRSEMLNLMDDLIYWFDQMEPESMVEKYTQIRQLVLKVEQIISEETLT